jgi:sulfur relay (sulfurtransferase) complex TusBCD TusD component (DsrE family)
MKKIGILLSSQLMLGLLSVSPLHAKEDKSMGLFINLTTIGKGQAGHALHFAEKQLKRGHPVTIFLNQKAVLFAAKATPMAPWPMSGKTLREMLGDLIANKAKVIVCQMCAKMQGVKEADLIEGAMLGNPELVADSLFDPSYQVISW